jgi:hypothetical protein
MRVSGITDFQESRDGIVKDIILKSSEGLQHGLICNGNWLVLDSKSPTARLLNNTGWTDHEFFSLLDPNNKDEHYKEDEYGVLFTVPIGNKERVQMVEDALTAKRCAEGELMLNTVLLDGTQNDYELAKNAVTEYLKVDGLEPNEDGDCLTVNIGGEHRCMPDQIAHWNDDHMVPTTIRSEDEAIQIGTQMAETFRAAADRL